MPSMSFSNTKVKASYKTHGNHCWVELTIIEDFPNIREIKTFFSLHFNSSRYAQKLADAINSVTEIEPDLNIKEQTHA